MPRHGRADASLGCRSQPCRRFASIPSFRQPAGSRPDRSGRITAWSSRHRSGRHWIVATCCASFRKITEAAGLGTDWVPRELRHTFVSLLSSDGMPLEDIADLVGHKGTLTTETVYRKLIVPELRRGAKVMDRLFR
jgi:integrase